MQGSWDRAKIVPTGEFEDLNCDLVSLTREYICATISVMYFIGV